MSGLFESLTFPIPPTSSLTGGSEYDRRVDGKKRAAGSISATTESVDKGIEWSPDTNTTSGSHFPKTPQTRRSTSASFTSNIIHQDNNNEDLFPHLQSTTNNISPSTSSSSSSLLLAKPGNVFWKVTPSPSQQLRQIEFQKYLSKTSPIIPLGSQAFREELLKQEERSPNTEKKKSDFRRKSSIGQKWIDDKTEKGAIDRRLENASTSYSRIETGGEGSRSSSSSTSSRRFTRRTSRRSNGAAMGDTSVSDRSQGGVEGMNKLLAELNQHLINHGTAFDDADIEMDSVQVPLLAEEQSLIDGLDRAFSQEDKAQIHQNLGHDHHADGRRSVQNQLAQDDLKRASLSRNRDWSRTNSLPSGLEKPNRRGETDRLNMIKSSSSHNLSKTTGQQRNDKEEKTEVSYQNRSGCMESYCELSQKPVSTSKRTSPSKRAVLVERQACQSTAQGEKGGTSKAIPNKFKTRSSSSSVSPPKKSTTTMMMMRTPRIGLSRHSNSAASQTSSQKSGPAAPFKKPSIVSAPMTNKARSTSNSIAEKQKEVIVIDDSDEDVVKKEVANNQARRLSPRKKSSSTSHLSVSKQKTPPPPMTNTTTTTTSTTNDTTRTDDEDTSFDTSMDETLLCEALDRVEATQKAAAMLTLQQKQSQIEDSRNRTRRMSTPTNCGDDSFEMASSDNEALIEAMEAGGW